MTIRDMKVFLAVCEMQSMSAAAAKLNISQSAVSQAIRTIEKHFDTKMFDRVGNKVYLTDSGRNMAGCSAHLVSYMSHMESLMRSNSRRKLLHVGAFGHTIVVDLTQKYQEQNSEPEIAIHVHSPSELISMLSSGVLDVIITDSKPSLPGLVSQYVCTNKAAFICHPNSKLHPLLEAERPVLQLQDLENMPMLLRDEGNTSRLQFDSLMLANNVNFFCKGVFTSYEGIFSAVDRDLGIGLATDRSSSAAAHRYKRIDVLGAELFHEVYISSVREMPRFRAALLLLPLQRSSSSRISLLL
ncbi:MAG: LysR family transcriptional regulator, partial [Oscillospiraceae bacterium]|nr:LysR family transcriptional regulator [Oscillospiraceae bacterium]